MTKIYNLNFRIETLCLEFVSCDENQSKKE